MNGSSNRNAGRSIVMRKRWKSVDFILLWEPASTDVWEDENYGGVVRVEIRPMGRIRRGTRTI